MIPAYAVAQFAGYASTEFQALEMRHRFTRCHFTIVATNFAVEQQFERINHTQRRGFGSHGDIV